jgi:hypothetical protein
MLWRNMISILGWLQRGLARHFKRKKSEVHKLSFAPAAYLPLLYRLFSLSHSPSQSVVSIILTFKKMAQHIRKCAVAFY